MLDSHTLTHFLAIMIGLYFLSVGIGLLTDRDAYSQMFDEMTERPLIAYLSGFVAFALGGTIVGIHNSWDGWLSGFVSLVGWIALVEGVLFLAFRKWITGIFRKLPPAFLVAVAVFCAVLGGMLIWVGLIG